MKIQQRGFVFIRLSAERDWAAFEAVTMDTGEGGFSAHPSFMDQQTVNAMCHALKAQGYVRKTSFDPMGTIVTCIPADWDRERMLVMLAIALEFVGDLEGGDDDIPF